MFTYTEADGYGGLTAPDGQQPIFREGVNGLGWDIRNSNDPNEEGWLNKYESLTPAQFKKFKEDVVAFNMESESGWDNILDLVGDDTDSFILRKDIVRIYSDFDHYTAQVHRHSNIGSLINELSCDELREYHPGLSTGVACGLIKGAMTTKGFTVNAHNFFLGLIDIMQSKGAIFSWGESCDQLELDSHNRVVGISTNKRYLEGCNFIISPGAYAGKLLEKTRANELVGGVLGAWISVPNLNPKLTNSMKLARKGHITEDANITIARDLHSGDDILIFGSGYGFTGFDPKNIHTNSLNKLYDGIEDSIRRLFPDAFDMASENGMLESTRKYCVRPWTSTSLGIFEKIENAGSGKTLIVTGHNTGGFAQAPAVASAVLSSLTGLDHPMHSKYGATAHA